MAGVVGRRKGRSKYGTKHSESKGQSVEVQSPMETAAVSRPDDGAAVTA